MIYKEKFTPIQISKIEEVLLEDFSAIKCSKEDPRLTYHLQDPFCPDASIISGVYVIYQPSVLQLLEGRFPSIKDDAFKRAKGKDSTISKEDLEYVLDIASVGVLASEKDGVLTRYFHSGSADRLDSLFNVCIGLAKIEWIEATFTCVQS